MARSVSRADDLVDALGLVALPVRSGEQVLPAAVAGGAAADVGEVVGVAVDELQRVVAVLLDRRDGQHQRFGAQVGADRRVRRVRVRRLDRLVLGRVNPCGVVDLVPAALVLGVVLVDEVGVLHPVVVDHREAVDVGLLGDGAGLLGGDTAAGRGGGDDVRRLLRRLSVLQPTSEQRGDRQDTPIRRITASRAPRCARSSSV